MSKSKRNRKAKPQKHPETQPKPAETKADGAARETAVPPVLADTRTEKPLGGESDSHGRDAPAKDQGHPHGDSEHHPPHAKTSGGWRALAVLREIGKRCYSVLVLCMVLYGGYLAGHYMVNTVFRPTHVPPRLLEWQGRLDVAALRQEHVPGMTGTASRAPLGHYHTVDRWFQADAHNTCTTAGCHEPLPHTRKMKVPAFANFHTTFLACQLCHQDAPRPLDAQWVSTTSGQTIESPAVLRLLNYFDNNRDEPRSNPDAAHGKITALLRQTLASVGEDPVLGEFLLQLDTSAPGGPVWTRVVDQLIVELPQHARGEYGAKLSLKSGPIPSIAADTAAFLAAADGAPERKQAKERIHGSLVKEANSCIACHDDKSMVLDYAKLGYSKQRTAQLRSAPVARMMQLIRQNETFYIPRMLQGQ